jgi:hypothetical protein
LAGIEADQALTPLQAASCTYRIALEPRAGQKVLSLQTVSGRGEPATPALCANAHGFSLHAAVRLAVLISVARSNSCAATSPARRSLTDGSDAAAQGMSYCV